MSPAALRVPLGLPLGPAHGGGPAWEHVTVGAGQKRSEEAAADDAWGAPDVDDDEDVPRALCTTSFFVPNAGSPQRLGHTLVLVGFSDGSVHVYAAEVVRDAADPPAPSTHTRQRSLGAPRSPVLHDAGVWEQAPKASASTAHASFAPTSPVRDSASTVSGSGASEAAHTSSSARSGGAAQPDAEALLEAQYHATNRPHVLAHSGSDVRTHVHPHNAAPHKHARPAWLPSPPPPQPSAAWAPEPLAPRVRRASETQPIPAHVRGVPQLLRSLYTPDASAVHALAVDDRPDAALQAQLVVHQSSGRITVWTLPALAFVGTVQVRVMQHVANTDEHEVQFVFERQATELGAQLLQPVDAYMHMARLAPCADTQLTVQPVSVAGGPDDCAPRLLWVAFPAWPARVFVLRADAVRRTLQVCAVLQAPELDACRCLQLHLGTRNELRLFAANDALHCATYVVEDLDALLAGRLSAAPTSATPTARAGTSTTPAPPGTAPPEAPSAARLSMRHLGLFLPAWTMPKHTSTSTHASKTHETVLMPMTQHRPLAALLGHMACSSARALAVLGPTCILGLKEALLLVEHGPEAPPPCTLALPSPFVKLYAMPTTRTVGVVCAEHCVTVHLAATPRIVATHACSAEMAHLAVPAAGELVTLATSPVSTPAPPLPFSVLLPLSLTKVVLAYDAAPSRGLAAAPLAALCSEVRPPSMHALPWDAPLTLLQQVANPRTGTRHLVGGSRAGDVGVWNVGTLQLEASWSWFAAPLQCIVPLLGVSPASRLFGCVLCVAKDGTTALLSLDDLRLVQMFPGSGAPLAQVAVRGHELLLAYGEQRARIWSLATQELVRSATAEQLWMLVAQADAAGEAWLRLPVPPAPRSAPGRMDKSAQSGMLSASGAVARGAARILVADVRKAVDVACKTLRSAWNVAALTSSLEAYTWHYEPAVAPRDAPRADDTHATKLLSTLRPLLAVFLPAELSPAFAQLRDAAYDGTAPTTAFTPASLGLPGFVSAAAGCSAINPAARFTTNAEVTAQHLLALVTLALLACAVPVLHAPCRMALDAALTPSYVGEAVGADRFVPPDLAFWAQFVLDENEALRMAAGLLFRQYVPETSEAALDELVTVYAPLTHDLDAHEAPHALLLLGRIASERYAYFPPYLLKQIAVGVARYLDAPTSARDGALRAYVALELCCHGCGIWQHYVDAVALVRGIFRMATQPEDATPPLKLTGLSLRGLARRATLELAARHSALFMSTLAMDILHAPSVEHAQVTLHLVAFMIRQKPLVLFPSLPRLVEAVVKSLDPTAGATRSAMAKSATLMINELVTTYPSIAFHGATQRLAVGTHEGPVVLYDLKTATRLYVLEGHKHAVTACTFSPDGRRFLSMSLEDECVLIWRLSTGLLDLLVPSAVSRRAGTHGQAEADRVLHIHLGTAGTFCDWFTSYAAHLDVAATLSQVTFEWPNPRSVRLRVGEAHVNLGVV